MSESLRSIASGIDFSPGQIVYAEATPELKEDLLQVVYPDGQTLDVGWYPEGDPKGEYRILVVSDGDWDTPLLDLSTAEEQRLTELILEAANTIRRI
ncbi:hypothetical protein [Deinococcus yunweiensis]|uniref:hypothetical protein n=1 Tax=Deinococcus yunweiensis TaxID=367282 RepID=UPI00398F7169